MIFILEKIKQIMYKIKLFIRKFKRWIKYTIFLWRDLHAWNEYEGLLNLIQLQLKIMSEEFERTNITMSSEQDARRMKLCSKLIQMYLDEHYSTKYYQEGIIKEDKIDFTTSLKWKKGYSSEEWLKTYEKDNRCLDISLRILKQDLPGWWQ